MALAIHTLVARFRNDASRSTRTLRRRHRAPSARHRLASSVSRHKSPMRFIGSRFPPFLLSLLILGCASTTVSFSSASPQASLCQVHGEHVSALILWGVNWRPDQKDIALREAAADQGIARFFQSSACFANYEIRHVSLDALSQREYIQALAAASEAKPDRVLVVAVRELGPVLKILSSAALVEGGTEVVLNISEYTKPAFITPSEFTVHWQNGGPGVVKGVATLSADMEAALDVSLKPALHAK